MRILLFTIMMLAVVRADYAHFEARQTHPLRLSIDGSKLLALNTPDGRLSVFDVSEPAVAAPLLIAEIPVGLGPVSLAQHPARPDEVWVVNEVSDSVSIVSLGERLALAHLPAGDEPADVAFAGGRAFVTAARDNALRVFDPLARTFDEEIELEALFPRAISASGEKLYIAAQMSGNRTTILPHTAAPAPPAPSNPALPPAPHTGLIVGDDHPGIAYEVLDHDIAVVDVATLGVDRYLAGVGTNLFAPALRPGGGELWVTNTESLNLVRFEPQLRGHFIDNRVTRIDLATDAATPFDLNPGIDYSTLPAPGWQTSAVAQPKAIAFTADGAFVWVAGFGSDIVAKVDAASGEVVARVDIAPRRGLSSRQMRGPRGLAFDESGGRLFVLNRVSNTLTVIDTAVEQVVAEVALGSFDPTPSAVREGRGFLFDARLSGNGTSSCASCHLDADRDGLAWDLGDPGGEMVYIAAENRVNHDTSGNDKPPETVTRELHPMKGPKVTQTLRGMLVDPITVADPQAPGGASVRRPSFHWRGDRDELEDFNSTYDDLMGGEELADEDFAALVVYLRSLAHHPNPHRNLDRTAPAEIAGGDPAKGRANFLDHGLSHCAVCHPLPTGTDQNIDEIDHSSTVDLLKTPPLLTSYQKQGTFSPSKPTTISGFGFGHDGTGVSLPLPHFYFLSVMDVEQLIDTRAYVLAFDSITAGTAPAVGHVLSVTAENASDPAVVEVLNILESHADPALARVNQHWNDVVVFGRLGGDSVEMCFDPSSVTYAGQSRAKLFAALGEGDALSFKGVPPGNAALFVGRRDPSAPELEIEATGDGIELVWEDGGVAWYLEVAETGDAGTWKPLNAPISISAEDRRVAVPGAGGRRLFRLRRTW